MFQIPVLAKCEDRGHEAEKHPIMGEPDIWLGDCQLKKINLRGIRSFDFFINWSKNPSTVQNVLWRKQTPSKNFGDWETTDLDGLRAALRTDPEFIKLAKFGLANDFEVAAIIYDGEVSWRENKNIIRTVSIKSSTNISTESISQHELQEKIKQLSGGPVSVGGKGLRYGTTTLECMLSKTSSAWPGDVDLLITDLDYKPKLIIEFKKHTLYGEIETQRLSNYYPSKDQRKYQRLALLRDRLKLQNVAGLLCVYYPVHSNRFRIKIESIIGSNENLRSGDEAVVELNVDDLSVGSDKLISAIQSFL